MEILLCAKHKEIFEVLLRAKRGENFEILLCAKRREHFEILFRAKSGENFKIYAKRKVKTSHGHNPPKWREVCSGFRQNPPKWREVSLRWVSAKPTFCKPSAHQSGNLRQNPPRTFRHFVAANLWWVLPEPTADSANSMPIHRRIFFPAVCRS